VSDRFHVVRTVLRHFLATWKQLDPDGRSNRGLLSLMRRHASKLRPDQKLRLDRYLDAHPAIRILYEAKESLCALLNVKHRTKKSCQPLIKRLIDWIWKLRYSGFPAMETLAETLDKWSAEIACMWRFTKNNGITEGFHTKNTTGQLFSPLRTLPPIALTCFILRKYGDAYPNICSRNTFTPR
jgi:transposase